MKIDNSNLLNRNIKKAREMVKTLWKFDTGDWVRGLHVSDINRDGISEVAIAAQNIPIQIIDSINGKLLWSAHVGQALFNICSVDADRDGEMEVIAATGVSSESIQFEATDAALGDEKREGKISIFSDDGNLKWEFLLADKVRGLAAADINNDNAVEIIMGLENNSIVVTDRYGKELWTFETGEWVYAIHLVDFNLDGSIEILAGSGDRYVYAFKNDGQLLWKYRTEDRVYSLDSGDVDGDGQLEIIAGSGDRNIYILGQDGTLKYFINANERVRNVVVADINHDGKLEIIAGLGDNFVYFWSGKGEFLWRFNANSGVIRSLKIKLMPNGNFLLVTGGEAGVVYGYEINLDMEICQQVASYIRTLPDIDNLGAESISFIEELTGKSISELSTNVNSSDLYQQCINAFQNGEWIDALEMGSRLVYEKLYLIRTYETGQWTNIFAKDINGNGKQEIVIGCGDRFVYMFDYNGQLLWKFETGERVRAVYIEDVDGDGQYEIIAGSGDRHVYILGTDGILKNMFVTPDRVRSIFAKDIDNDKAVEIIAGIGDRSLTIYNKTGGVKWEYIANDRIYSVYADDIDRNETIEVVCGSGDRTIYAFSNTGNKIWERKTGDWVNSVYIYDVDGDGYKEVLVGSGDRYIHCLDGKTGTLKWKYETGERVYTVYVDDLDNDGKPEIIAGSEDKYIYVLNSDGDLKWKFQTQDWIRSLYSADLNKDGRHELIVGSYGPNVRLYGLSADQVVDDIIRDSWIHYISSFNSIEDIALHCMHHRSSGVRAIALEKIASDENVPYRFKLDLLFQVWQDNPNDDKVSSACIRAFGNLYVYEQEEILEFFKSLIAQSRESGLAKKALSISVSDKEILDAVIKISKQFPENGFKLLKLLSEHTSRLVRRDVARACVLLWEKDVDMTLEILYSCAKDESEWVRYESARTLAYILDRELDKIFSVARNLLELNAIDVFDTIREMARENVVKVIFSAYQQLLTVTNDDLLTTIGLISKDFFDKARAYRLGEETALTYDLAAQALKVETISEIVTILPQVLKLTGMIGRKKEFSAILTVYRYLANAAKILERYEKVESPDDKAKYLVDSTNEIENAETNLEKVIEPDHRILLILSNLWKSIIVDALQSLTSRALIDVKLKNRRVYSSERVVIEIEVINRGKGVAQNAVVEIANVSANEQFIIEGPSTRKIDEPLYSGETFSLVYTLKNLKQQFLELRIDVCFDDFNERGKRVRASEQLTVLDLPGEFEIVERNPYIYGTPITSDDMFFGRNDVIDFVKSNLTGAYQNNVVILHGERRTGKTSILYQLQKRLQPKFFPVLIDISGITVDPGLGVFLYSIAQNIYRKLDDAGIQLPMPEKEAYFESPAFQFREVFLPQIAQHIVNKPLLLLLDEIGAIEDAVRRKKLDDDIFQYLRSIIQHTPNLSTIITGAREIKSLTLQYSSSLFNIGAMKNIGLLASADAVSLITKPVQKYGMNFDDLSIEKILDLTSGHPFFTQMICHELVDYRNKHVVKYISINDINNVAEDLLRNPAMLTFVWDDPTLTLAERIVLFSVVRVLAEKRTADFDNITSLATTYDRRLQSADVRESLNTWVDRDILLELPHALNPLYRFKMELVRLWVSRYITPQRLSDEILKEANQ